MSTSVVVSWYAELVKRHFLVATPSGTNIEPPDQVVESPSSVSGFASAVASPRSTGGLPVIHPANGAERNGATSASSTTSPSASMNISPQFPQANKSPVMNPSRRQSGPLGSNGVPEEIIQRVTQSRRPTYGDASPPRHHHSPRKRTSLAEAFDVAQFSTAVPMLNRETVSKASKESLVEFVLSVNSLFHPHQPDFSNGTAPGGAMSGELSGTALSMDRRFSDTANSLGLGSTLQGAVLSGRHSPIFTSNLEKGITDDGFKLINEFLVLEEIGRGSYGKVKLAADTKNNDKTVAIKVVSRSQVKKRFIEEQLLQQQSDVVDPNKKEESDVEAAAMAQRDAKKQLEGKFDVKLLQEVAILKKVNHPNIVNLREVIDDPASEKLYFVMQYIERGPLLRLDDNDECPYLDSLVAKNYMRQLCGAVYYLHKQKVVHRDIKPDNILLGANGRVYLSDFGVSSLLDQALLTDAQGTPAFMAPEVLRGDKEYDGYASDVWSLGVTFFLILYGELPFKARTLEEMKQVVLETDFKDNPRLIDKSPDKRWGVDESAMSVSGSGNVQEQPSFMFPFDDPSDETHKYTEMLIGMLTRDPLQRWTIRECRNFMKLGVRHSMSMRNLRLDSGSLRQPGGAGPSDSPTKTPVRSPEAPSEKPSGSPFSRRTGGGGPHPPEAAHSRPSGRPLNSSEMEDTVMEVDDEDIRLALTAKRDSLALGSTTSIMIGSASDESITGIPLPPVIADAMGTSGSNHKDRNGVSGRPPLANPYH